MKLEIKLSDNNTHIVNSYIIKTRKVMESKIEEILTERRTKGYLVTRSINSYVREWKGHNRLYNLHLFRSRTKDVDLEEPSKWYLEFIWLILGGKNG